MANYEETFGKLVELHHMMGALRHRHARESGPLADTTRGRGRVLALLKMRDGLSTREMANVLGIRVSSLNETVARMEAEGLVERRQSQEDGRVMLLFLTDAGRAAEQPELDLPRYMLLDFTDEELQTLDGYLDRMSAKLEERLGEGWREHERCMRHRREQIFHQAGGPDGEFGPGGRHHGGGCGRGHGPGCHDGRGRAHHHGRRHMGYDGGMRA